MENVNRKSHSPRCFPSVAPKWMLSLHFTVNLMFYVCFRTLLSIDPSHPSALVERVQNTKLSPFVETNPKFHTIQNGFWFFGVFNKLITVLIFTGNKFNLPLSYHTSFWYFPTTSVNVKGIISWDKTSILSAIETVHYRVQVFTKENKLWKSLLYRLRYQANFILHYY